MTQESTSIGKGYVQVYTGNCKGKTTAAMGLAFRAMGAGLKTYFGQFMKGQDYSELKSAQMSAPYITMEQYGEPAFIHRKGVDEKDIQNAKAGLEKARESMNSGQYQIVVLDEICTAAQFGLVTVEEMLQMVTSKPDGVELVLTGRGAPPEVIEAADLVTEMTEIKHYYTAGVPARVGVER